MLTPDGDPIQSPKLKAPTQSLDAVGETWRTAGIIRSRRDEVNTAADHLARLGYAQVLNGGSCEMDLTDRVVLITGVKRIGAVVAEALAGSGADIALVYNRSAEEANAVVDVVRGLGRRAIALQADLSSPDSAPRVVDQTLRALGRLDVLVAMASLYARLPLPEISVTKWNHQLEVDLRATFLCAQAAAVPMKAQGGGRMIFFSDWVAASGRPRYPGYVHYYVGKAGVKALTESLALELADDQILVNAIAPGPILAPPDMSPAERQTVADATPLGRWGGESEIAKTVTFLIQTDFVTGETVRVDGGRHLK